MKLGFYFRIIVWSAFLAGSIVPHATFALSAGGLGGRPAHPDSAIPYSDSWFIYNLGPGESTQDALVVTNSTDEPAIVKLYPVDSVYTGDGNFSLEKEEDPRDGIGSWVVLSTSTIPVAPHSEVTIPFTITIPSTVSVGEHAGGIIMQKAGALEEGGGDRGASILTRVGVRIYETVPGELVHKVVLTDFSVTLKHEPGRHPFYEVVLTAKNDGNVSLKAKTTLVVSGWGKLAYFPRLADGKGFFFDDLFDFFKGSVFTQEWQLSRGQEVRNRWEVPQPRFGKFSFQAIVTYDGASGPQILGSNVERATVLPLPEMVSLLALVALVAVLGFIYYSGLLYRGWVPYTVAHGDQLFTIASRAGVSWKKIKRVNRLSVPHVHEGQKIRVPASFARTHTSVRQHTASAASTTSHTHTKRSPKRAAVIPVRVSSEETAASVKKPRRRSTAKKKARPASENEEPKTENI